MKKRLVVILAVMVLLALPFTVASAQFANPWVTSYMLQNLGTGKATVVISYFDQSGNQVQGADKALTIDQNSSATVVQYTDDPNLPPGRYSAVVSSDQEIAAVVNQQTAPGGLSYMNSQPPFGSYSGATAGGSPLSAPEILYNWFGYYSQVYIQNTSGSPAHVTITFIPGLAGASGVTESATIAPSATYMADQKNKSALAAPGGQYAGRFSGSAVITSDQPVVAIVNELNDSQVKLFSYNAFAHGATNVSCPSILRGHFGWYTSLAVANPDPEPSHVAHVTLTYTADTKYSLPANLAGTQVTKNFDIAGGKSVLRYDGSGNNPTMDTNLSDLTGFTRFFGDVQITSDIPVVAKVNQENTGGNAEAYNCIDAGSATTKIAVPLIQTKFFNFYTSLTIKNTSGSAGTIHITYKSDGTYSSPTNTSVTVDHPISANGQFNSWEGGSGGDVYNSGMFTKFNGSAIITSDVPIIAIVNEEKKASGADYGYSFNVQNVAP